MLNKGVQPGEPYQLGANWDGKGVHFALFSENATQVELLLFESTESGKPIRRIDLTKKNSGVWHTYAQDTGPGQLYAYCVHGTYEPEKGHRFNPSKVLIDPYAKAIAGTIRWNDALFGYHIGDQAQDLSKDERDSGPYIPRCVVVDSNFDWEGDQLLNTPWHETVIYEVHIKGFTAKHPAVEEGQRGTYAGFASPKVIEYLKDLGVTAVELLPIHHHVDDKVLVDRGLSNYWGYNTIGFFAPDSRYSSSGILGKQVPEFKAMVKALHRAEIEIILDVVYNHTAEGNHLGPTLSFRGIDNASYYHLDAENPRYYVDFTGCGNGFNMNNPYVLRLIKDSLLYWILEMHVDGFRFDLASALARELHEVDFLSDFFEMIHNDPTLSKVKLIAEPWDLGEGGYQVGNFPALWSEWNGKFRDTVRRFIKGDPGQVQNLAWRITGSADLYKDDGRSPYNSVNFITCHDGFTLNDLFSYNSKHNEANLEDNRDGTSENNSWNCGVEGETDDLNIIDMRKKMTKNALCCLLFSSGTPMILGGDEFMRTQQGNNNAYCQDNEITWFDWGQVEKNSEIIEFCKKAIALRRLYTVLERRKFFSGKDMDADNVPDISWFGENLKKPFWNDPELRTLCYQLDGSEAPYELGDYHLFFILNADSNLHSIKIPQYQGLRWFRIIDTSLESGEDFLGPGKEILLNPPDHYQANPRSTVVLLGK